MKYNSLNMTLAAFMLSAAVLCSAGCSNADILNTGASVPEDLTVGSTVVSEVTASSLPEEKIDEKEPSEEISVKAESDESAASSLQSSEDNTDDTTTSAPGSSPESSPEQPSEEVSAETRAANAAASQEESVIDPIEDQRRQMEESVDQQRMKIATRLYEIMISEELNETSASIETELMSQYPELPTGCESVALTMALNSLGFGLEKTDIAEKYLPYGYSCITSFVGDPTTYDGAGIFPPGLTYCANNIIKKRTNKYYALDTTGTELEDLFKLIENGCPVVVWSTLYLGEPYFTGDSESYNGRDYPWYTNEHCIVLYGYDTKKTPFGCAIPEPVM